MWKMQHLIAQRVPSIAGCWFATMIRLRNALAIAAVLLWLTAFVLFLHFADTRPTSPKPVEGRVYRWNDHGRFVYLNNGEQNQLYVLGGTAAVFFVTAATLGLFCKDRRLTGKEGSPKS
jgi:hypothetical protein